MAKGGVRRRKGEASSRNLLAACAILVLSSSCSTIHSTVSVPAGEQFVLGDNKTALKTGEVIKRIFLPLPADRDVVHTFKQGDKRRMDAMAVLNGTFYVSLDDNGMVRGARICLGGLGRIHDRNHRGHSQGRIKQRKRRERGKTHFSGLDVESIAQHVYLRREMAMSVHHALGNAGAA